MSVCKRCKMPIVWGQSEHARTPDGGPKWIAVNPDPDPLGVIDLKGKTAIFAGATQDPKVKRYMPHEATCVDPYKPVRHRTKESHR